MFLLNILNLFGQMFYLFNEIYIFSASSMISILRKHVSNKFCQLIAYQLFYIHASNSWEYYYFSLTMCYSALMAIIYWVCVVKLSVAKVNPRSDRNVEIILIKRPLSCLPDSRSSFCKLHRYLNVFQKQ